MHSDLIMLSAIFRSPNTSLALECRQASIDFLVSEDVQSFVREELDNFGILLRLFVL